MEDPRSDIDMITNMEQVPTVKCPSEVTRDDDDKSMFALAAAGGFR